MSKIRPPFYNASFSVYQFAQAKWLRPSYGGSAENAVKQVNEENYYRMFEYLTLNMEQKSGYWPLSR
ncbi:hypothetical protein AB4Z17_03705 [Paenibacillus sp. TAF43_2]|uniref:hypothetical protein n=1 Tax=Paenibacillus sp. TAF43_2 TaxID=3233069 RepID=UPI003F9A3A3D